MLNSIKVLLAILLTLFSIQNLEAAQAVYTPIGQWKTIDDVTGKQKSIIKLFLNQNRLYGRITQIFPDDGNVNKVCSDCTDYRKNQKIVGMIILENLTQGKSDPNEWSGGTILDPKNGKIYRCYIDVVDNNHIKIRGYLGISLFGRTQNWYRVK